MAPNSLPFAMGFPDFPFQDLHNHGRSISGCFCGFMNDKLVLQVGTYHSASLRVNLRPPTPGVVSRGIALEGLCSILAGLWGSGTGSTTLTEQKWQVGGWRGSAFLRNRSAISTLPSHESERATKYGTTTMAHEGGTCLVLQPLLLPGLEDSVRDSDVEGFGETFRILRGWRGILEQGSLRAEGHCLVLSPPERRQG
ncbi:Nucleobase-ascorbate transporter [Vigna angularis]|uniref:Nucleobase-ascorbate transporter n=1 Tax=Phaseolus angularis TaxID=3914 RepID=A0A8T0K773_PHAAN|nr:Nucleobase-ascorbate transporter [Vigna angularis]